MTRSNHQRQEGDGVAITFDAEDAGIDSIIERFERLATKWAPRPRKPKATI